MKKIRGGGSDDEPYVVSLGRSVYASSIKGTAKAEYTVDGNETTRWESEWNSEQEWIYIDLGKITDITGIEGYIKSTMAAATYIINGSGITSVLILQKGKG